MRKSRKGNGGRSTNNTEHFYERGKFMPVLMAKGILESHLISVITIGGRLYRYDKGVYKPDGEAFFRKTAAHLLDDEYTSSRVEQALDWLKAYHSIDDISLVNPEKGLINVKNGLLQWSTGKLFTHTPDFLCTIQIPVEFDPDANDGYVLSFLQKVIPEDALETVIEYMGYCLTTNCKYEKALMATGTGSNGKSTFINMLTTLLGKVNVSSISLHDLEESRFKLAEIENKLLNTFADLPRKSMSNASNFKMIVSGDVLNVERKQQHPFELKPFAKLIFSTNELPKSGDLTNGFFRRWIFIPFNKQFTPDKADVNLSGKLTTPQAQSTLLNLAVEGLRRLNQNGKFTVSASSQAALEEYRRESDNVRLFVEECCILGEGSTCKTSDLYAAYGRWCKESGYRPLGKGNFNKRIKMAFNLDNSLRVKGESTQRWKGLALRRDSTGNGS